MRFDPILGPTLVLGLLSIPVAATAQEGTSPPTEPAGWSGTAEATFVFTGGNSSASSLGFRLAIGRDWLGGSVALEGGGIRVKSSTRTLTAIGNIDDFSVLEETLTSLTAENYYARVRFDHPLGGNLLWYVGGGWERNHFAGIDSRYAITAGLARIWFENERSHLRTDLGLTYTQESFVTSIDGADFGGLRFSWDVGRALSDSTTFESKLIVDDNLAETADLRADFLNSLAVAMSDRLALKISFQVIWDNRPALVGIPLVLLDGFVPGDIVLTPLGKTDSLLTLALVVNF